MKKQKVSAIINSLSSSEQNCGSDAQLQDNASTKDEVNEQNFGMTSVWGLPSMNQQERAAVETIHQWQVKGYEVIQDPEGIAQVSYPIPSTVQQLQGEGNGGDREEKLEVSGELPVYANMQAPGDLQNKPSVRIATADMIANATAAAGIQVIFPNSQTNQSEQNLEKQEPSQWVVKEDTKAVPCGAIFLQPIYPQVVHKQTVSTASQWQEIASKPDQRNLPGIPTVVQPLFTEIKSGEQLIKENCVPVSWPVSSGSRTIEQQAVEAEAGVNEVIIQGYEGSFY